MLLFYPIFLILPTTITSLSNIPSSSDTPVLPPLPAALLHMYDTDLPQSPKSLSLHSFLIVLQLNPQLLKTLHPHYKKDRHLSVNSFFEQSSSYRSRFFFSLSEYSSTSK